KVHKVKWAALAAHFSFSRLARGPRMTQNEAPVINPNSADDEELRQLPGVGPKLASRIIAGRPYQSLEDLRQLHGLGDSVLGAIEPFLTFEPQAPEGPEENVSEEKEPAETEPAKGPPQPDRASVKELKYPLVRTEPRPQGTGIWALLAMGAASVLCSVTLTLAVLAGINGTLDFGRHSALQATRSELLQIRSQLDATQVELEALRGRAQALEGVSGRMAEVEGQVAALQQQIGETVATVDEMQMELTAALEETRAQAERVNRFQTFLDGLSRLVGQVITEP
ncbi:MAG: helix-hairpin-helix domain-containing protein, partial [Anaerolineales bacterium]